MHFVKLFNPYFLCWYDIVDLLKVQKDILGVNKLTDGYREAADVNKDGVVDIIDLLKIQKHILGVSKIEQ